VVSAITLEFSELEICFLRTPPSRWVSSRSWHSDVDRRAAGQYRQTLRSGYSQMVGYSEVEAPSGNLN
jgi:hypothetical protein